MSKMLANADKKENGDAITGCNHRQGGKQNGQILSTMENSAPCGRPAPTKHKRAQSSRTHVHIETNSYNKTTGMQHVALLALNHWRARDQECVVMNAVRPTGSQPPYIGLRKFVVAVGLDVVYFPIALPFGNKSSIVTVVPTSMRLGPFELHKATFLERHGLEFPAILCCNLSMMNEIERRRRMRRTLSEWKQESERNPHRICQIPNFHQLPCVCSFNACIAMS